MNEAKRVELWDARFSADFRHRYFVSLKGQLATKLRYCSLAIALLSCGPVVGFLSGNAYQLLSLTGILAGVIGIYVSVSGLAKALAVASQGATLWGHQSGCLAKLWARAQSGEDVWREFEIADASMQWVDAVSTDSLNVDRTLVDNAWKETNAVLATAQ